MPGRRRIMGGMVVMARVIGWALIALAIVSLPPLRTYIGHWSSGIEIVVAVAVGLMGFVWLIGVELFLRFFDQFMSRN